MASHFALSQFLCDLSNQGSFPNLFVFFICWQKEYVDVLSCKTLNQLSKWFLTESYTIAVF
jgi:hypothetical protein